MEENIYLIDSSYKIENEKLYIEFFGKNIFGESIAVLIQGFYPYFHILDYNDFIINELERDINVINFEKCELYYEGKNKSALIVWLKYPFQVPFYRKKFSNFIVVACDVLFTRRYLFDNNFGAFLSVEGEEIVDKNYTTDKVMIATRIRNAKPFEIESLLKILSFDIETSMKTGEILCLCVATNDGLEKTFYGREIDMIDTFKKFINKYDPDVISGYNIEGFDFSTIIKRLEKQGKDINYLKIGRNRNKSLKIRSEKFVKISGRCVADAWRFTKKYKRPKRETLAYVSKKFLGETKLDIDVKKLDVTWKADREKVLRYCLQDARLPIKLLNEIGVIKRSVELSTVSKLPLEDIIVDMNSVLIDSLLIREFDRNFVAVPRNRYADKTSKIKGAYVQSVKPGLYDMVIVGDFRSLYPSLIIKNNVCITTLHEDGEIVSPIGAKFLTKEKKLGILPKLMQSLVDRRQRVKVKIKATTDKKEKEYLKGLSEALKILSNANYGVFASSFYRFTNRAVGESITTWAREAVQDAKKRLEDKGLTVILADTDSCYFLSPYEDKERTIEFGKKIQEELSSKNLMFEFEKIFDPFFTHGKKKRYIGKIIWPEEDTEIKGYETRRTDSFDLQSRTLEKIFDKILERKPEDAIEIAKKVIGDIKNGRLPINDYVISRTVKSESEYKTPDRLANVQARRKLAKLGIKIPDGMKVSYIVVDGSITPQEVEPYINGDTDDIIPDKMYYIERMSRTLSSVLEPFGLTKDALEKGQKSLLDYNGFGF